MKSPKRIKNDTIVIMISVISLTILTLGVSYSAFFDIKIPDSYHEFTAGDLQVAISSSKMSDTELFPTPDTDLPTSSDFPIDSKYHYATLTLTNNNDFDIAFNVTVNYDTTTTNDGSGNISFDYLNVGILSGNTWVSFDKSSGEKVYNIPISNLVPNAENAYPILKDTIPARGSKEYKIYIWLNNSTPVSEIGKLINLKLDVKSTTVNGSIATN